MGTAARVGLGLGAPGRPGFLSLGRGTEAWFVSGERRAFPAPGLLGADEVSGSLLPGPQPDGPEGSRRVFLGDGSSGFSVCNTFFGRETRV